MSEMNNDILRRDADHNDKMSRQRIMFKKSADFYKQPQTHHRNSKWGYTLRP